MTNWTKVDICNKVIKAVEVSEAEIVFKTVDDSVYKMLHLQDCCEYVYIDKYSDIQTLIGSKIIDYDETSEYYNGASESGTITYFNFKTDKGKWKIKWIGESNGYYSEDVTFMKVK